MRPFEKLRLGLQIKRHCDILPLVFIGKLKLCQLQKAFQNAYELRRMEKRSAAEWARAIFEREKMDELSRD